MEKDPSLEYKPVKSTGRDGGDGLVKAWTWTYWLLALNPQPS